MERTRQTGDTFNLLPVIKFKARSATKNVSENRSLNVYNRSTKEYTRDSRPPGRLFVLEG